MTATGNRLLVIVEDSHECADILKIALETLPDFEILVFAEPRRLWRVLEAHGPRVAAVITDLHLSGSDGFDLIRQLRADDRFARVPIVLISGDGDPRVPDQAIAHGASAFFAKPYSPQAVRRKLEELLC